MELEVKLNLQKKVALTPMGDPFVLFCIFIVKHDCQSSTHMLTWPSLSEVSLGIGMLKKASSSKRPVNQAIHGTYRENSLYHFLMDHLSTTLLSSYRVDHSRGDRQALYIDLPVPEDDVSIFSGFKLMRQHLSVDQYILNQSSPLSRYFSPTHGTFEYENSSERWVARAYFNRLGQFIDFKLKCYPMNQPHTVGIEGVERLMNAHEKKRLREHAEPCQALLQQLLNEKSREYIALYQSSFQLDEELSQAVASKKLAFARLKAHELIQLTSKLTRYNDTQEDGRTGYLTRMLATLNDTPASQSMEQSQPTTSDVEPELSLTARMSLQAKVSQKTTRAGLTEEIVCLVDHVVRLTQAMHDHRICQQVLVVEPQLRALDDLFLLLELNAKDHAVKTWIDEQRKRLPTNKTMGDYFNDCMLAGDLESVSILFPTFSQRSNLYQLSSMLISTIKSNPPHGEQLIRIADYFYEHSEIYRSCITLQSQLFSYSPETQLGYGLLFGFFKAAHFDAFSLALRHGVSPDASHVMKGARLFNLLQALILYYEINPNLDYIHAAFEYGAQVDLPKVRCEARPQADRKKTFKDSAAHLMSVSETNALLVEQDQKEMHLEYNKLHQINHALTLACQLCSMSHSDLIHAVAQHSSPEMALLETARLLIRTAFNTRFIAVFDYLHSKILRDKNDCDAYTKDILERPLTHHRCCFLFYMNPGITTPAQQHLFDSAKHLLARSVESYAGLEVDEQRRIIKNLTDRAIQLKDSNEHTAAIACYKAVQLAYTMISNPSAYDHQVMVHSFAQIATLIKAKYSSLVSCQEYYSQVGDFLRYLPAAEFEPIKDLPVVKFVLKKIETEQHHAVREESRTVFTIGASKST